MVKGGSAMLIGELSKKTGLSRDTIRFYEREGLIEAETPVRKGFFSNSYKDYTETVATTLFFIQRAKTLGFTLAEIREMLNLRISGTFNREKWSAEVEKKRSVIDRKLEELNGLKVLLGEVLANCADHCFEEGCGVLDKPRSSQEVQKSGSKYPLKASCS